MSRAHVDTLDQLSKMEIQLNGSEEQWRSRCDALEESLASTTRQLQVRCLTSSLYLTAVTWWILTACVGPSQNFLSFSSGAHLNNRSPGGGDEDKWGKGKDKKEGRCKKKERKENWGENSVYNDQRRGQRSWLNLPPSPYLPHPLLSSPPIPCTHNPPKVTPEAQHPLTNTYPPPLTPLLHTHTSQSHTLGQTVSMPAVPHSYGSVCYWFSRMCLCRCWWREQQPDWLLWCGESDKVIRVRTSKQTSRWEGESVTPAWDKPKKNQVSNMDFIPSWKQNDFTVGDSLNLNCWLRPGWAWASWLAC